MPLSKKLIEDFEQIKNDILRRYNRSKVYAEVANRDPETHPNSALPLNAVVETLEPVAHAVSELDLESYDKESFDNFSRVWTDAMKELPNIYPHLERADAAYDDVWNNMNEIENLVKEVIEKIQNDASLNSEQKTVNPQILEQEPKTSSVQQTPIEEKIVEPKEKSKTAELFEKEEVKKTMDAPYSTEFSKKQQNKDILQTPENLMNREDVVQNTKTDETPKSNKAAIQKLRKIVDMVDRKHSDESFRQMMVALKDVADSKLVSDEMVDAYRNIFGDVKKHRNTEKGILDLSAEIYNQIEELETADRESQNTQSTQKQNHLDVHIHGIHHVDDLEKKQENKDVLQKPDNLLNREDAQKDDPKGKLAEVKHKLENFKQGNQKVLDMDKECEDKKQQSNEIALAAYRRKVLLNRGNGNV
ncbi:MAG: hypothetical protein J5742_02210 [Alphaproteobacteria bacterium]|nr:hypothetical protein [Alphaproteobacteria bacterium]